MNSESRPPLLKIRTPARLQNARHNPEILNKSCPIFNNFTYDIYRVPCSWLFIILVCAGNFCQKKLKESQTDRQGDRQAGRKAGRQTDRWAERCTHRQAERQVA